MLKTKESSNLRGNEKLQDKIQFSNMGQTPKPKKSMEYMFGLAAATGALATGICIGWTSTTEDQIIDGHAYDFKVNKNQFSWVGSFFNLGAACISLPIGFLLPFIGHKYSLMLLVIPFTLGWALIIWAQNIEMLWIGRFITGMGAGGTFVIAPLYLSEIASKEIRGRLGSLNQIMLTLGILLSYALGWIAEVVTMSLICAVVPIFLGVIFIFMPQSPTYLVSVGKLEDAKNSIQRIRGREYDHTEELDQLKLEHDKYSKINLYTAMYKSVTLKPLFICSGLMAFQQLSGINAIVFYPDEIFSDAHADIDQDLSSVILPIIHVFATIGCGLSIDYTGRRNSLLISGSMMSICSSLVGLFFYMQSNDENSVKDLSLLPVIVLCVYMVAYSSGYGPCPWILVGELFSTKTKSIAAAIINTFKWLSSFAITKSFISLKDSIGKGQTFWLFAFFAIMSCIFVGYFLPETKGKSLPEIQLMLADNWRKIGLSREEKTANVTQSSNNQEVNKNNQEESSNKKKKKKIYPF